MIATQILISIFFACATTYPVTWLFIAMFPDPTRRTKAWLGFTATVLAIVGGFSGWEIAARLLA